MNQRSIGGISETFLVNKWVNWVTTKPLCLGTNTPVTMTAVVRKVLLWKVISIADNRKTKTKELKGKCVLWRNKSISKISDIILLMIMIIHCKPIKRKTWQNNFTSSVPSVLRVRFFAASSGRRTSSHRRRTHGSFGLCFCIVKLLHLLCQVLLHLNKRAFWDYNTQSRDATRQQCNNFCKK